MQRYLETLFRRKWLFIAPAVIIPLLVIVVTYYTGSESQVSASVWVEPATLLDTGVSFGRVTPNIAEGQIIGDRLKTFAFREDVMNRSGLTDAILAGAWPETSALQERIGSNSILRKVGKLFGMAPPSSTGEAMGMGMAMLRNSVKIVTVGDNLVIVAYNGKEPMLGQRIVEEVLALHQEATLQAKVRESAVGVDYLTREVDKLQEALNGSTEELLQFEEEFPTPPLGLSRPPDEMKNYQRLQQVQQLDQERYLAALNRLEELRLRSDAAISTSDLHFRIVDPPVAGSESASISPRKLVMMGMLGTTLGIMVAVGAVVFLTWKDSTVRTRTDVERAIRIPSIVEVPTLPASRSQRPWLLKVAIGLIPLQRNTEV